MPILLLSQRINRQLPESTKLLEYSALFTVVLGVWFIGEVNIIGQYLMVGSQLAWFVFGWLKRLKGLCIQSVILLVLAIRAIIIWSAA